MQDLRDSNGVAGQLSETWCACKVHLISSMFVRSANDIDIAAWLMDKLSGATLPKQGFTTDRFQYKL